MKNHTSDFEEAIKTVGKQQSVRVIFTLNDEETIIGPEDINSATPHYEGALLKSVMKELELDSNIEIPLGTEVEFQYGLLVNDTYEWIDFGKYIVTNIEKKEDTNSFEIKCQDKMIWTMVDYIDLKIEYPITVRNYIATICNHLKIDFGSNEDKFVNYDKEIPSELYLDADGNSLDYTFRNVLDELAQVTASTICIDENDKLVVRYPQDVGTFEELQGTAFHINADSKKMELELQGQASQDGTPTPDNPIEIENVTGEQNLKVIGSQLLQGTNEGTKNWTNSFGDGRGTFSELNEDGIKGISRKTSTPATNYSYFFFNDVNFRKYFFDQPQGTQITISFDMRVNLSTSQNIIISIMNTTSSYRLTANTTFAINFIENQWEHAVVTLTRNSSNDLSSQGIFINIAELQGVASQIDLRNLKAEYGTEATDYEPYVGKDYNINLGKNLLKPTNNNRFQNGITCSYDSETQTYTFNGTSTSDNNTFRIGESAIDIKKGLTTMYAIWVSGSATKLCNFRIFNNDYSIGYSLGLLNLNENNPVVKRTPDRNFFMPSNQVTIRFDNGSVADNFQVKFMIADNIDTNYAPYFEPIELNKIGDYQDFIRKGTGKNLLGLLNIDRTTSGIRATVTDGAVTLNGTATANSFNKLDNIDGNIVFNLKKGTYTLSANNNKALESQDFLRFVYYSGGSEISGARVALTEVNASKTFTLEEDIENVILQVRVNNNTTLNNFTLRPQLEKSSQATSYEPYGYGGKWYIEKNTEKIQFDGTEDAWTFYGTSSVVDDTYLFRVGDYPQLENRSTNYYLTHWGRNNATFDTSAIGSYVFDNALRVRVPSSIATTQTEMKNWVADNRPILYLPSANPSYSLIDNEELIKQLEAVKLQYGENNIAISGELSIKLKYLKGSASIDEENLNNVNVNFGEKYGPINSVVIARAADSDFIYKEDEESVAENGLCEVRISDNQILNDDNRKEFLDGIYDQLHDTEFYLNDFSSKGIVYLDLLDYYNVKVFGNSYRCLMLNDEIDITQGLEEQVFTERPEETETEYKSLSKQDKNIRKIGIIVNKVDGEITAEIEARKDTDEKVTRLQQDIDSIQAIVKDIEDLTETKSEIGTLKFEKVNNSQPFFIRIHPTSKDIIGLVPRTALYPSLTLMPNEITRTLNFYNETEKTLIAYLLPCNLYYYNKDYYDEFYINFDAKECYVVRKVKVENGVKSALTEAVTEYFDYPTIWLTDGDYSIYLTEDAYLQLKLMKQNDITKQFAGQAELQSSITELSNAITLETSLRSQADDDFKEEVNAQLQLKVGMDDNDQVISMINASADKIELNSNRFILNSTNMQIAEDGTITSNNGVFNNVSISNGAVDINADGIQMSNGTSIVGGQGMLTQFMFSANDEKVGFDAGASVNMRNAVWLPLYIPSNFSISSARLIITHNPIQTYHYNSSIDDFELITGYGRNVKLYYSEEKIPSAGSYFNTNVAPSSEGTLVSNFGSTNGKTFSSSYPETLEIDIDTNIFRNGKQYLYLADYVDSVTSDDLVALQRSGGVDCQLILEGYVLS